MDFITGIFMACSTMEELVSLCKRRGFIFQSNDIYGGIKGLYDYGPMGVELKNKRINNITIINTTIFIINHI